MNVDKSFTGSVRLVDRKLRVVEVLGPEPMGSRRPSDRKLLFDEYGPYKAGEVGFCFQADGRRAKFLIDEGQLGDKFLDLLAKHPKAPARPARPYGMTGWVVVE